MSQRNATLHRSKQKGNSGAKGAGSGSGGWQEPANCTGPWGERHMVRVGSDGRVCYFGECDEPGEWVLESLPFPSDPCTFDICAAPDGTPYVAGICDTGEVFLCWRNGPEEWECDSVGKNALYDDSVELEAMDDHTLHLTFFCWNPASDDVEQKIVEYGRRYCTTLHSQASEGHSGGSFTPPATKRSPKARRGSRKR